ncbi:MAG: class I SAM-dependent methyltransferase [Nanoarchaeota archaeon]|nr:class I SAM-dependent methyltransferase [Nanoarchaeota archaeon]
MKINKIPPLERITPGTEEWKLEKDLCLAKYICVKNFIKGDVLEVGCGYGYGSSFIADNCNSVIAIDKNKEGINSARKRYGKPNLTFVISDFFKFEHDKKFDTIIAMELIEHLDNYEEFIELCKDMLKKNGKLILSTPNKLLESEMENEFHKHEFYPDELKTLLERYFNKVTLFSFRFKEENKIFLPESVKVFLRKHFMGVVNYFRRLRSSANNFYMEENDKLENDRGIIAISKDD